MLRQAALRLTPLRTSAAGSSRRAYAAAATSAQKRALKKSQIDGGRKAAPPTPPPPKSGAPAAPPPPPSSGKGGGSLLPVAVVGVLAVGGAAYYYSTMDQEEPSTQTAETTTPESASTGVAETKEKEAKTAPKKPVSEKVADKVTSAATTGNRVLTIELPTGSRPKTTAPVAAPAHPAQGNRVNMHAPPSQQVSAKEAAKELSSKVEEEASERVQQAHAALRANLDESLFQDLDQLSTSELRVRVVQLAAEMKERTKWEAVRLKEFLALKEKETAEKYMELMQKQRLEAESEMARQLRAQEDTLNRQAQAALNQKEDSIQQVVQAAADAQTAEHEADLASAKERFEADLNAKYETEFAQKLVQEKIQFSEELEKKASLVEELSSKLGQLELALKESRAFETGSLRAHRLSAAALALAEKLETSKGASEELTTLKSAARDNTVIQSALSAVPDSVKMGVPTLSELQTRFESVYKKTRQAAMVPAGRAGVEGQLMGMVFATLKYPPGPEEAAPEDAKNQAEYVLARARRHVQLGELDRAVEQLDKLEGQAAFTVKDWKQSAMDRVAINKTLRAIKLESALLNESISAGSTPK